MDGGLVSDPPSESGGGSAVNASRPKYYDAFEKLFPYYLSIGMTPEQYWDGDPTLARAYRRAQELKLEQRNEYAWLQGMYIYEALGAVSPIFRSFAKRGTKAMPYVEAPYPITKHEAEQDKTRQEKNVMEKGKAYFAAFMAEHNKRFAKSNKGEA